MPTINRKSPLESTPARPARRRVAARSEPFPCDVSADVGQGSFEFNVITTEELEVTAVSTGNLQINEWNQPEKNPTLGKIHSEVPMFELMETYSPNAVIRVIGVGGGGCNAINHMMHLKGVEGVEFIAVNTDAQALKNCGAKRVLQLGQNVTKGLGAGANPEVGRQAALEDREKLIELLKGADMVFITTGMGGGTGTGASPIMAQLAKEMGILTVAVVTKPFPFEGKRRMASAIQGISELSHHVDSLITIPNEKLLSVMGRDVSLLKAFSSANDVLLGAVQGIADLITRPGLLNLDFADVKTVMSEMGMAMMGSGVAKGDDRAVTAAEAALGSPLLEDVNLAGACGILVNITAGPNLTMREFEEVNRTVTDYASEDATVKVGTVIDPEMQDELKVTVVVTGINREKPKEAERPVRLVKTGSTGDHEFPNPRGNGGSTIGMGVNPLNRRREVPEPTSNSSQQDSQIDYLDIPAFLRRQAD
jgi:cell division protein FtsZ